MYVLPSNISKKWDLCDVKFVACKCKLFFVPPCRKLHLRFSRSIFLILNFVQGRGVLFIAGDFVIYKLADTEI